MAKLKYFGLILLVSLCTLRAEESCDGGEWQSDNLDERCSQSRKQKAMYGIMTFQPSLSVKPMIAMEVDVEWNTLRFNPCTNTRKKGGVYVSYTTGVKDGPAGYFGVQITGTRGQLIFSIWDYDRFVKVDGVKQPKPAGKLAWPVDLDHCKRNCQDCGIASLVEARKKGLTTGAQCIIKDYNMKEGDRFTVKLKQLSEQHTINTANYGGFKKAHEIYLGENDRDVTGGLWEVTATKVSTGKEFQVGKILFEGDGRGMNRLGTFDEMLGCNRCNSVQHKDTRYGPVVTAADDSVRVPVRMQGTTRADDSNCKRYFISGSKDDISISFEGGPLTATPFDKEINRYDLWK